jgi:hypothetical protein
MRWRFHDPSNLQEKSQHDRIVRLIDEWWNAFAAKTDDLAALFSQRLQWDLPAWMDEHLHAIDPRLYWEFGPALRGDGHRLVITPETDKQLRPIVSTILGRAPSVPRWEFYPYRVPESLENAEATVHGRCGGSLEGYMARASIGEHNLVDLVYHSPGAEPDDDPQATKEAFIATETLLGEERLDKWIGAVEAKSLAKPGLFSKLMGRGGKPHPSMIPLDRLGPTVESLISSIRDQLPDRPYHQIDVKADGHGWGSYGMKPEQADDYPARTDLIAGATAAGAMCLAAHSQQFYSERFSRFGETFCYLKIDGSNPPDHLRDREVIEDAIDAALIPHALGRSLGGATGIRYSYVDLALTDLDRTIPILRTAMRTLQLPHRAWLIFWDADLADEWVGIHDDTPPPPMPPPEE